VCFCWRPFRIGGPSFRRIRTRSRLLDGGFFHCVAPCHFTSNREYFPLSFIRKTWPDFGQPPQLNRSGSAGGSARRADDGKFTRNRYTTCTLGIRFKSHLRYLLQKDLRKIDVSPFFVRKIVLISILAQECESGFVVENSVLVVELKIDQILSRG
jgi:hypothetical protein